MNALNIKIKETFAELGIDRPTRHDCSIYILLPGKKLLLNHLARILRIAFCKLVSLRVHNFKLLCFSVFFNIHLRFRALDS